jgi:hypothetical protein
MSVWSDLSNAAHIDRVLASVNKHPRIWSAAHNATRDAAWGAVRHAAWNAARNAAWNATRDAARDATLDAAYDAILDAAYDAGRAALHIASRDAILALIAYDDCDQYLAMTSEELRAWALLTEHPAAILLLPAVIAFERIAELERAETV